MTVNKDQSFKNFNIFSIWHNLYKFLKLASICIQLTVKTNNIILAEGICVSKLTPRTVCPYKTRKLIVKQSAVQAILVLHYFCLKDRDQRNDKQPLLYVHDIMQVLGKEIELLK